jgi:valyl-tRNA synthetase
MPDHIWRQLYSRRSVHAEHFPKPAWSKEHKRYTKKVLAFNSEVWKMKKDRNLALRDPIDLKVPRALAPFRHDLVKMHSLQTKSG